MAGLKGRSVPPGLASRRPCLIARWNGHGCAIAARQCGIIGIHPTRGLLILVAPVTTRKEKFHFAITLLEEIPPLLLNVTEIAQTRGKDAGGQRNSSQIAIRAT